MAYVLEYTVSAGGVTKIMQSTSHANAVAEFVKDPRFIFRRGGEYEAADGEQIVVVGYSQQEYADRQYAESRVRALKESIAKRGRAAKGEPDKATLRERLAEAEGALHETRLRQHVVTFKVNHVVVRELEYLSGLPIEHSESVEATL